MKTFLRTIAGFALAAVATGTPMAAPETFDAEHGMALLQENKFEAASNYFTKYLAGNAVAHYGLALTKFRRDTRNLSPSETKEIIALYERAISLDPSFADAFFMCGMAYNAQAGFQLVGFNKDRANLTASGLAEADAVLAKAEQYLRKATRINPGFSKIAEGELQTNQMLRNFAQKLGASL